MGLSHGMNQFHSWNAVVQRLRLVGADAEAGVVGGGQLASRRRAVRPGSFGGAVMPASANIFLL